jgi:hypothetical protein
MGAQLLRCQRLLPRLCRAAGVSQPDRRTCRAASTAAFGPTSRGKYAPIHGIAAVCRSRRDRQRSPSAFALPCRAGSAAPRRTGIPFCNNRKLTEKLAPKHHTMHLVFARDSVDLPLSSTILLRFKVARPGTKQS